MSYFGSEVVIVSSELTDFLRLLLFLWTASVN